jgi:hypothetical protein
VEAGGFVEPGEGGGESGGEEGFEEGHGLGLFKITEVSYCIDHVFCGYLVKKI